MPPYQQLYYVLGVGVGVSAVVTALPFHFVYAALFLFVCGYGVWCMVDSNKKRIPIIGIGVLVIVVRLGVLRYTQVQAQANIGSAIQGIAQIEEVHTKEKSADVIVNFDKNNIKATVTMFGGQIPVVGSHVSAYCIAEKIPEIKDIPFEKMKAVHNVFLSCKKFAWSLLETHSWHYTLARYREHLQEKLGNNLEPENKFLLDGMVFGDEARIAQDAKEDFKKSGISHILAVSGFNIALFGVWGLSMVMWLGIPRKVASVCMIILIVVFVEMVGGGASVIRAAIMGCIPLCGALLHRTTVTNHIFWVTVLYMIVWQPYSLWYDIGFQLSATATAGLIYGAPYLAIKFPRLLKPDGVITQTLAATIVTAPVLLWHFGNVSLLGLITNTVVAVPVVQIMGLAVVRLVMSTVGMGDEYGAMIQDWLLTFLYQVADLIAQYDFMSLTATNGAILLIGGVLLFVVRYRIKRKSNVILINNEEWYIISI